MLKSWPGIVRPNALLFMAAESIIHNFISKTQDMREFGGLFLFYYLPFTYTTMAIASPSLSAGQVLSTGSSPEYCC